MISIAYSGFLDLFHIADSISDLSWGKLFLTVELRLQNSDIKDLIILIESTTSKGRILPKPAAKYIKQANNILATDKPTIQQEQFQGIVQLTDPGTRNLQYNPFQHRLNIKPRLGTNPTDHLKLHLTPNFLLHILHLTNHIDLVHYGYHVQFLS